MSEFVIRLLKRTAAVLGIREDEMINAAATAFCSLQRDAEVERNPALKLELEALRKGNERDADS